MKRWAIAFTTAIILAVIGFVILVMTYRPSIDPELVHPEIRRVKEPTDRLNVSYHTDGGSVSIYGRDAEGEEFYFMLPHPMGQPSFHDTLYIGYYKEGEKVDEVKYPDSRSALFLLVETHGPGYLDDVSALSRLSRGYLTKLRVVINFHTGYYKRRPI